MECDIALINRIKLLGIIIIGGVSLLFSFSNEALAQQQSFQFEGIERDYEVYLPQNLQENIPLLVGLHGYSETVSWFNAYSNMDELVDSEGFILVLPKGIDLSWNVGIEYCPLRSFPNTNDVGFISALIDTLYQQYSIDLKRVYGFGFSTGGEMVYRLACEIGERFAAVAVVGSSLLDAAENWKPNKAMPVLHIGGTKDMYALYNGPGSMPVNTTDEEWSVKKTLDYWIDKNQCDLEGDTVNLPDLVLGDSCTAQKITFGGCSNNTEIIHFKIIDGGHSWPGSSFTTSGNWEGNRNMDIDAKTEIWNFFKNYENSLAYGNKLKVLPFSPFFSDTVFVTTTLINPDNNPVSAYAIFQGEQFLFNDTLELFDDGLNHDGEVNDNLFGNILLASELPEDSYNVNLFTYDSVFESLVNLVQTEKFINFGPVVFEDYSFNMELGDAAFYPGGTAVISLIIKNVGTEATATNINAKLVSLNSHIIITENIVDFENLGPVENATSELPFLVRVSEECPINEDMPIVIHIFSNNLLCWTDSFNIQVYPTDIIDNSKLKTLIYPNPTNDVLNIEFSDKNTEGLVVEIFSVTGKRIYRNDFKNRFQEEIDISGYSKGIYFLRIWRPYEVSISKIIVK
jgi:polyhydroxybutyrate depolymerase